MFLKVVLILEFKKNSADPDWNATLWGISFGSSLIAKVPVYWFLEWRLGSSLCMKMENSEDPDQLASYVASWSGSTLFSHEDISHFRRALVKMRIE